MSDTTALTTLPSPSDSSEGGLSRYLRDVWKFPILAKDEEYMLAKRFQDSGDVDAAHQLVTSHLRLVAKIAMGYKGYGLPVADLVSEGNIGLMRAVKKFEPERGFRLATYAMWWIRASVTEYILQSWSMVRLGTMAAQKKLFFSLRKAKNRLGIMDNGELTPEQADALSEETGAAAHDVLHLNRRLASRDMSLNTPMPKDEGLEYMDVLPDEGPTPEALVARTQEKTIHDEILRGALETLSPRDREIFVRRRLEDDPPTLEELGEEYGVSRERVRQLEARAMKKVSEHVLEQSESRRLER